MFLGNASSGTYIDKFGKKRFAGDKNNLSKTKILGLESFCDFVDFVRHHLHDPTKTSKSIDHIKKVAWSKGVSSITGRSACETLWRICTPPQKRSSLQSSSWPFTHGQRTIQKHEKRWFVAGCWFAKRPFLHCREQACCHSPVMATYHGWVHRRSPERGL